MNNIGWCDETLNPFVGCSHCSPGCDNCYAERFAARLAKNPATAKKYAGVVDERGRWTGKISAPDGACFAKLPKAPRRVFVGSMTDLFHPQIPFHWLDQIFLTFLRYPQHTFLVLTKRPERAAEYFPRGGEWITDTSLITGEVTRYPFPIPNLWLGVTVCNQAEADEKIPFLLDIPAAVRFISFEPLLGPITLWRWFPDGACPLPAPIACGLERVTKNPDYENGIHWVIAGGETGPGARPMHPEWARSLRDQCVAAGVPFYFKGWGEWRSGGMSLYRFDLLVRYTILKSGLPGIPIAEMYRIGKKRAGCLLDDQKWCQFPEAL